LCIFPLTSYKKIIHITDIIQKKISKDFRGYKWATERTINILYGFFQAPVHKYNHFPFQINSHTNAYSQVHLMGEDGGGRWCAVKKLFVATVWMHDFIGSGYHVFN